MRSRFECRPRLIRYDGHALSSLRLALVLLVACHHAAEISTAPLSRAAYGHYLAGKAALYGGDPDVAATELSAAALAAPDQPMIAVEQARALAKSKQDPAARDVLAKARLRWPDHAQVWLASGELLEKTAPADAIRSYRRAIEIERDDERAYLGLARALAARKDQRGAEATLRSLVARVPASFEGHYRLAQRLVIGGDLQAATIELRAVLEHDPDHIDARLDLARVLRRLGKLDEAIAQTRGAFDRAGQPLDVAEELFWLLCEADQRTAAIDLLTLLDDDRSDAEALATVARLDIGLGRIAEATAIAARIAPQDADAATIVILAIDLARHDPVAARTHALAVAEKSSAFADARRIAAETAIYAGDAKAALELVEPARQAKPDDLDLALTAATALADLHRTDDALGAITSVKADEAVLALAKARLADHRRDPVGALALLEPIIRAHPDNVTALNLAGYLLADRSERLDDAERYLRHARELAAGDPAVLDSWGWLRLRRGDSRGAIRALDQASRYAPGEPEILLHLATAVAADHAPAKAAEILDRATALRPSADIARRIAALRSTLAPSR
jgi:Flp pilus assembly protein TadD